MPLTAVVIRNAKPPEKPVKLFDERGLHLEVSHGGKKWWRLTYRFDGKEKRLPLGLYPDVNLKDARKLLANGTDPGEHGAAQKLARADCTENSFEGIAREWPAKYSTAWA